MSNCKSCDYNFKSYNYFSSERIHLDLRPGAFNGGGDEDTIAINHPDYYNLVNCWQLMRDACAGQEAIKANAFEFGYVIVPPGLVEKQGNKRDCTDAGQEYIERGRFPEVPLRHLLEVEGQLFSEDIEFNGPDELLEVADELDSQGLTFEQFARSAMQEYFKIFRLGVYIQFNEEQGRPEFVRYPAESIVNYKMGDDGFPSLIVIEETFLDDSAVYSHVTNRRRIQLSMEEDRFVYRVFIYDSQEEEFVEDEDQAVFPTRNGQPLERIPFVMFGSWEDVLPPLKPIVNTTIDYFRAHVEWSHGLFYSAHPTLFANIQDGGAILSAEVGDDGEPLPYDIDIGAACAHVFQNGVLQYAEVSGAALSALETRVSETRNEFAGLGARSFINYNASNITSRTESLQQSSERGVLATFSRDISHRLTECLFWAAEWMGLNTDGLEYSLDQTQDDEDFDIKCLPQLYEGIDRGLWSARRITHFARDNITGLIPITDEELAQEIADEGAGLDLGEF